VTGPGGRSTAGWLPATSVAALEATLVSTVMPTVIATLGGLAHYRRWDG